MDSLEKLLETELSTEDRVMILLELSEFADDVESEREHLNKALTLTNSTDYLEGKVFTSYDLGYSYYSNEYETAVQQFLIAIKLAEANSMH